MGEDDITKKNSFLYVIRYDTSTIKDGLLRLKDLGLADLMSDIEDQIGQVDAALQFLDAEKTQ
jgi:hypothetical protein